MIEEEWDTSDCNSIPLEDSSSRGKPLQEYWYLRIHDECGHHAKTSTSCDWNDKKSKGEWRCLVERRQQWFILRTDAPNPEITHA